MKRVNKFVSTGKASKVVERGTRQNALNIDALKEWAIANYDAPVLLIGGFITGLIIGLCVLGWYVFPVQWTDATFNHLGPQEKVLIVQMASDLSAYNPDSPELRRLGLEWEEVSYLACLAAEQERDQNEKVRFMALAYKANGQGCID